VNLIGTFFVFSRAKALKLLFFGQRVDRKGGFGGNEGARYSVEEFHLTAVSRGDTV
jgi:hypothetical protein